MNSELEKARNAYDSSHLESAQLAAQVARLEAELTSLQDEHVSTLNQVLYSISCMKLCIS